MRYKCISLGWYHELLEEVQVEDLAAAELSILVMLDRGGMIVHAYRETDLEQPEMVGRHARLGAFFAGGLAEGEEAPKHEVERFLLDASSLDSWSQASDSGGLLEQRWSVIDLWTSEGPGDPSLYGKALLMDCVGTGAHAAHLPPKFSEVVYTA